MARSPEVTCDRCGDVLASLQEAIVLMCLTHAINPAGAVGERHRVDLCPPCGARFGLFMAQGKPEAPTP